MTDDLCWNEICDIMSFRSTSSKDRKQCDLDTLLRELMTSSNELTNGVKSNAG